MTSHLHLYFAAWQNESRAWRAGQSALDHGLASAVFYVGHKSAGLADVEEVGPSQTILRVGAEPPLPGSPRWARATALPRWWTACGTVAAPKEVSLVVAHSLAALPAAVGISRRKNVPLLYDAHELETERNGWSRPIRQLAKAVERHCLKSCAHTTVVNDSIRAWYEAAYPEISVSTVRNVPHIPQGRGESGLRRVLGLPSDAIVFVYCGALAEGRGLTELVQAFEGVGPDRRLVLIGHGPLEAALRAQSQGRPNVHLHPAVPQAELITLLSGADVGVMTPSSEALSYQYCLPNKVFEYAAAGLAICVGTGPELQRFAESYPAARTTAADADSLRSMVLSWDRRELDAARPLIASFKPPSWEEEERRQLDAFRRAIENGPRATRRA